MKLNNLNHIVNAYCLGGKIFIDPTNCEHWVWTPFGQTPYVTINSGKTWTNSTGASTSFTGAYYNFEGFETHCFANDRINGKYWYGYDPNHHYFYVSNDGGYTWKNTTKMCSWEPL